MSINWGDLTDFQDISSGSFGIVRKADYLGTDVAVKEFLDISDQPGFDVQKYIGREVEILGSVHHPNVLQFMGICVHEKKVYLVTELITGGHLKAWIQGAKKDTSWRLRVSFATDIARALVYLHAHRIIHRDLKSENLLLTENFRLKICDFGLSREVALTIDEKNRLSFCGTDGYMAPEIILGMSFDERVDIFSYGIILCEIITMSAADKQTFQRETPFFGIDPATVKPDDPAGCPRELLEIAIACTDADPDKRPILKDVLVKLRKLETELMKEVPLNFGVLGSDQALSPEGRSPSIGSLDGSVADESVDLGNSSTHSGERAVQDTSVTNSQV
ncbi:kinase-like domain-containing protein [Powellomyces hirtus]|nr:kinase-like domain-containing protein [Powellomyces hirtus]